MREGPSRCSIVRRAIRPEEPAVGGRAKLDPASTGSGRTPRPVRDRRPAVRQRADAPLLPHQIGEGAAPFYAKGATSPECVSITNGGCGGSDSVPGAGFRSRYSTSRRALGKTARISATESPVLR